MSLLLRGIIALWLFSPIICSSQVISGSVVDSTGNSISKANILFYTSSKKQHFLSYAITKENGTFEKNITPSLTDSIFLEVNHLGFKIYQTKIVIGGEPVKITLINTTESLDEVIIERKKITQHKDTIAYNVNYFKKDGDRSIGDVMKRLPGIDVRTNGQIYFQGEPIEKYYIEGLDLLEGRYNIANKNINASDVSEIQILENHQPIKILDDVQFSEKTSLNLKLKKEYVKALVSNIAIGSDPLLRDIELIPILLSKKHQFIGSFKSNNFGKNIKTELNDFSAKTIDINTAPAITGMIQPISPPLAEPYWLLNNSNLGSINYLKKLTNGATLKFQTSYFQDESQEIASKKTTFLNLEETSEIVENIKNSNKTNTLSNGLIYELNSDKYYFKNKTNLDFTNEQTDGFITGTQNIDQFKVKKQNSIINEARIILKSKSRVYEFNNTIAYLNEDTSLKIFVDSLQLLKFKNKSIYQDASTNFKSGFLTITPKLSLSYSKENLTSLLEIPFTDLANNEVTFSQEHYDIASTFSYKKGPLVLRGVIPLRYYNIDTEFNNSIDNETLQLIALEPSVRLSYSLSSKWKTLFNTSITNDFGDIDNLFKHPILRNYRSQIQNDAPLQRIQNYSFGVGLQYKNVVKGTFTSLNYNDSFAKNNLIFTNTILPNGQINSTSILRENIAQKSILSITHSKSFYSLSTLAKISSSWTKSVNEEFINNNLIDINQNIYTSKLEVNFSGIKKFLISYNFDLSFYSLEQGNFNSTSFSSQNHYFSTSAILGSHTISASSNYYTLNASDSKSQSSISNFLYRYTFKKKRISEIYFKINNISNQKVFEIQSNNSSFNTIDTYQLRPRQFIIGTRISL